MTTRIVAFLGGLVFATLASAGCSSTPATDTLACAKPVDTYVCEPPCYPTWSELLASPMTCDTLEVTEKRYACDDTFVSAHMTADFFFSYVYSRSTGALIGVAEAANVPQICVAGPASGIRLHCTNEQVLASCDLDAGAG